MAVLEITGNFGDEKKKSNERFDTVAGAISTISAQIDVLSNAWQDEKSAEFISAIESYTSTIKTKLAEAQAEANSTFGKLMECLNIY